MVRRAAFVGALVAGLCVFGCAAGRGGDSGPSARWIAAHGGVVGGSHQHRLQRVGARLSRVWGGRDVRAYVLDSADAAAYAWADGRILVTRGLIRRLDDDQLAAVIAHELGHLINESAVSSSQSMSLSGQDDPRDAEARADATGVALLEAAGLAAYPAMRRMLQALRDAPGNGPFRQSLTRRIELLDSRSPPRLSPADRPDVMVPPAWDSPADD
ncbi:M48 family metalloprotease [Fontivita pretiosa]|uniref:M48 family metalloprotease n=1 Tax=Fontivita pretiosa TaxID=2989684 RepID=UPI003D16A057